MTLTLVAWSLLVVSAFLFNGWAHLRASKQAQQNAVVLHRMHEILIRLAEKSEFVRKEVLDMALEDMAEKERVADSRSC